MSAGKAISLDEFRQRKEKEKSEKLCPGVLVWLYCSNCSTIEYTELIAPYGRSHKCGTQVQEVEVEVDLRAEYTITSFNLDMIDELLSQNKKNRSIKLASRSLDNSLIALKKSEETYIKTLLAAANEPLEPYPGNIEELRDKLPIRDANELGLLISEFRFEPQKRFNN